MLSKLRSFTTLAMVISSSVKTTMKKSSMAKSSCRVLGAIASKQIFSHPWHLMCSRWLSWTVSEDPWPVFLPCGCVTCLAIMYSMCSLDNSGLVRQDCGFSMAKGQRHKGIIGHRLFCIELRTRNGSTDDASMTYRHQVWLRDDDFAAWTCTKELLLFSF